MEQPFMEVVTNKIETQDKKIANLEQRFDDLPDASKQINEMKSEVQAVGTAVQSISFPVKEMQDLSRNLTATRDLLKQPREQKVIHYHRLDKWLWIVAILMTVVVVLVVLLTNARSRIHDNEESDIKYRHMKLSTDKNLRSVLEQEDSIYQANPDRMQENVIAEEEWRKKQAEMFQEALEKEREARELKAKAKDKPKR